MHTEKIRRQNAENKTKLANANIDMFEMYNALKDKYFSELIKEMGGTKRKFYQYLKSKRMGNNELPATMTYKTRTLIGEQRMHALNEHFASAYTIDDEPIPN